MSKSINGAIANIRKANATARANSDFQAEEDFLDAMLVSTTELPPREDGRHYTRLVVQPIDDTKTTLNEEGEEVPAKAGELIELYVPVDYCEVSSADINNRVRATLNTLKTNRDNKMFGTKKGDSITIARSAVNIEPEAQAKRKVREEQMRLAKKYGITPTIIIQ